VADGRTDGFAIARTNIALLGNVRQKYTMLPSNGLYTKVNMIKSIELIECWPSRTICENVDY